MSLGDQSVEITKVFIFVFEEANLGSCCFEFLWELGVEVWPRQASVPACVCSCGNKRGD